jgi:SAM-dependent methyltransferase
MTEWWKDFFDADYLRVYQTDDLRTAQREADFVRKTLKLRRGQRLLDICCGYGRHSLLLARAGLSVTGFDHSRFFLNKAHREARKAGLNLTLVEGDVRAMSFDPVFDAAINMFTAIGYFESDEENYQIIARAAASLKPGGQFLLDTINREYIIRNYQSMGWQEIKGGVSLEARSGDWERSRLNVTRTLILTDGSRRKSKFSLRIYTLAEVVGMFERAGLEVRHTFGGFDGTKYKLESPRIIVVGRKPRGKR